MCIYILRDSLENSLEDFVPKKVFLISFFCKFSMADNEIIEWNRNEQRIINEI